MRKFLKALVPRWCLAVYHYLLARAANLYYGHPSEHMVVIGVTGTNGKSTTARIVADILTARGKNVGLISTAEIQIGAKRQLNDMKMTMPGRMTLQKLLRSMADTGCEYAVVETSSQGIEQYRHIGINYDVAVFTNLTPEHIEAHGGFEAYKRAKGRLFSHLTERKRKVLHGKTIPKIFVVNLDDPHAGFYLQFPADKKYGYTFGARYDISGVEEILATDIELSSSGSSFIVAGTRFHTSPLGRHNVYNCFAALTVGYGLGFSFSEMVKDVRHSIVPGRMEFIDEGQKFFVIVDYAPEPKSLSALYDTIQLFSKNRVIHVVGSCGGGRDRARRPVLGRMAGKFSQYVIVTNEDPYDDDPLQIMKEVAAGAREVGKKDGENLYVIFDRREAIQKAFEIARRGDMVLITGKGCEQAIVSSGNKKIPWDDRAVARDELKKIIKNTAG